MPNKHRKNQPLDQEQTTWFLVLFGWAKSGRRWWKLGAPESVPVSMQQAVKIQRSANAAAVLTRIGWKPLGDWQDGFVALDREQDRVLNPVAALKTLRETGALIWNEEVKLLPTVALPSRSGRLSGWCFYCDQFHHHSKPDGHRTAHCVTVTPYSKTGYLLRRGRVDLVAADQTPVVLH